MVFEVFFSELHFGIFHHIYQELEWKMTKPQWTAIVNYNQLANAIVEYLSDNRVLCCNDIS